LSIRSNQLSRFYRILYSLRGNTLGTTYEHTDIQLRKKVNWFCSCIIYNHTLIASAKITAVLSSKSLAIEKNYIQFI
jgi:hypothetical protein